MAAAAQYETAAHMAEAWQRISSTQLRKKIVKTWTRVYVGIPSAAEADTLLETAIGSYANVYEGNISLEGGGMWSCTISFKTAVWATPAQYKDG